MNLLQSLTARVSSRTRTRGAAYFSSGAVTRLEARDGAVHATVIGSDSYDVRLTPAGSVLRVSCTCPYFADHLDTCKHVWATLLAADAQKLPLLARGVSPRTVHLAPVDAFDPADADDDRDEWTGGARLAVGGQGVARQRAAPSRSRGAAWQKALHAITAAPDAIPAPLQPQIQPGHLLYVIDIEASRAAGAVVIELMTRLRRPSGEWGRPKPVHLTPADVGSLPPGPDRPILERLLGARPQTESGGDAGAAGDLSRFRLQGVLVTETLPLLCAGERCAARTATESSAAARPAGRAPWRWSRATAEPDPPPLLPLAFDDGAPWRLEMTIRRTDPGSAYHVDGTLRRGGESMALSEPLLVLEEGLLVTATHVARLDHRDAFAWLAALRDGPLTVPSDGRLALVDALLSQAPPVDDPPPELRVVVEQGRPRPRLRLTQAQFHADQLEAELFCDYGDLEVEASTGGSVLRTPDASRIVRRDHAAERGFFDTLYSLGFRQEWSQRFGGPAPQIPARQLTRVVRALLAAEWQVEAKGVTYRQPAAVQMHVSSGIDWFDLDGHADYGGQQASLPALLAAQRRGDSFVTLGDGTLGLLPREWLRTHGALARLATPEGDRLRFTSSQVALLDALLEDQPEATADAAFSRAREQLLAFDGIAPADPPASFTGTLRGYQRDGLGWLLFLQRFGFGGCLADDMGLGKTVMVLALLALRHAGPRATPAKPSLVVAPRSVLFNWREEAARFTPDLRVLEYVGSGRAALRDQMTQHDVVLTTYGTLRRDAAHLAPLGFAYVILDESQAIKNASSAAAKATRLLRAEHRLALSGTPIENHLGELWSLFEFLNPGLLGGASAFEGAGTGRALDEGAVAALARGLRPFILRRTKEQVAPELPRKTEQTLRCELERPQRALYDELRDHYRRTLLDRVSRTGLGRAKLQVLEALLRLRQAACHPGLIDATRKSEASAKLDVLLPRLREAVEEGHKTLVFSQFTSFLAILRTQLDAEGVTYEYLDGHTRDRQSKVERFQSDPDCRLFLISLKAGGVGLNLTAADYVFLLDPWWNPAVEAQAIDRAHRIGQARHVFAYRLIARDTVEERVLELQQHKRTLADAVLSGDGSLMKELKREDLELLLS